MRRCATCGIEKEETEFNWRYKYKGERHVICRECQKGHNNRWLENHKEEQLEKIKERNNLQRQASREFIREYLSTHPCVDCGETDPIVLEFDHIHSKYKDIAVLVKESYSIATIRKEIAKCEVVCANCHRRRTHHRRNY